MNAAPTLEDTMRVVATFADGKLLAGRIADNVGVMMFNQPAKRNAVSLEMWDGVCSALDLFAADNDIRVVVYAGAGDQAFTSGNDISQFAERRNSAQANEAFTQITGRGRDKLAAFGKPSIACVQGWCMGGGLGIALQADVRVAAKNAVFGVPATRLGLAYAADPLERLIALVGPARARLLVYTARRVTAAEAFAMGLVEVLARDDAVRETLDLAREIAANAPLSVQAAKFTIDQLAQEPSRRDLTTMAAQTRRCMDSADYKEGRAAFLEKRKPLFTGA